MIVRKINTLQALIIRQRERNIFEAFVSDVAAAEVEYLQAYVRRDRVTQSTCTIRADLAARQRQTGYHIIFKQQII